MTNSTAEKMRGGRGRRPPMKTSLFIVIPGSFPLACIADAPAVCIFVRLMSAAGWEGREDCFKLPVS